jgi:hypothetical protein
LLKISFGLRAAKTSTARIAVHTPTRRALHRCIRIGCGGLGSSLMNSGYGSRLASRCIRLSCPPVEGAHVDVWHCNANGVYSDEPAEETIGRTFLRGCQVSDVEGSVRFTKIFPGWYAGRAVHIHLRVRFLHDEHVTYDFTTQLFFDEGLIHEIHTRRSPYDARGKPQVANADDYIYRVAGPELTVPLVAEGTGGYRGSIVIGLSDLPPREPTAGREP